MAHLHRTQIYIDEDQLHRLQIESRRERTRGISELIRKAIDAFLKKREANADWREDPLAKAVGKIRLTVSDAAEKHDRYLYR